MNMDRNTVSRSHGCGTHDVHSLRAQLKRRQPEGPTFQNLTQHLGVAAGQPPGLLRDACAALQRSTLLLVAHSDSAPIAETGAEETARPRALRDSRPPPPMAATTSRAAEPPGS